MMSKKVDIKSLEKRLSSLKETSEDIQALTRWCIQHKNHHHSIVQAWSRAIRKAKVSHRLTLFYACNDIVQNARRKKFMELVQHFGTAIKEAAPLVREEKIRKKIVRTFHIWEARGIYDSKLVAELVEIVENVGTVNATEKEVVLSSFQLIKLIEGIRNLIKYENTSKCLFDDLKSQENVFSEEEIAKLQNTVKERGASRERLEEFDESMLSLECYNTSLQKEIEERTTVVSMLEQAEIFYETQRGEAKLVANAYRNFSSQVKTLKSKLTELMTALPEPDSPIASPPPDAPSPTESDNDDEISIVNPTDSGLNSFMDSTQIASMAQEALKDFEVSNAKLTISKASPHHVTESSNSSVKDNASTIDHPSKSPGYSYRESYSNSYREYDGRSRKRSSSSREKELDKEQKEFEAQISKISKTYLDPSSKSFKDQPKPMSAQELLDTFGKAYLKEKTGVTTNDQSSSFAHSNEQTLGSSGSLHISPVPMPPPVLTSVFSIATKTEVASSPGLTIPLPPSNPSTPHNDHPEFDPLPQDNYSHHQAMLNMSFPLPPPAPYPQIAQPQEPWRMEASNVWNSLPPPPPPPPPPPLSNSNSERESYSNPQEEWNDFTRYDDTPDLNEDETDNRNWGEVPGAEELQALSAEPNVVASIVEKIPYFPSPSVVKNIKELPTATPALSTGRIKNLVNIEPLEQEEDEAKIKGKNNDELSSNYRCYDYRSLAQDKTAGSEIKRKKDKSKLVQDSGSDMDISDSDSTDFKDNESKATRKQTTQTSNFDQGSNNRPRTIIPLAGVHLLQKSCKEGEQEPVKLPSTNSPKRKNSLDERLGIVNLPTGVVDHPTAAVKLPTAVVKLPTGVVKLPTGVIKLPTGVIADTEKNITESKLLLFNNSSNIMDGVDTAAISEALKHIKERSPIENTVSLSERLLEYINEENCPKPEDTKMLMDESKSMERAKSMERENESFEGSMLNERTSPVRRIQSITEALSSFNSSGSNFPPSKSSNSCRTSNSDSPGDINNDSLELDDLHESHYSDLEPQIPITPHYSTSHFKNDNWNRETTFPICGIKQIESITQTLSEIRASSANIIVPKSPFSSSGFGPTQDFDDFHDNSALEQEAHYPENESPYHEKELSYHENELHYRDSGPHNLISPVNRTNPQHDDSWNRESSFVNHRPQFSPRGSNNFRGNWGSPYTPRGNNPFQHRGTFRGRGRGFDPNRGRGRGFDPSRGRGSRRPLLKAPWW